MNILIWCSGELKDYQIIFHWQRWAEERPSEQTGVQTSALAEPATGTTDHKHEALTSNGTFPFIAGSELKQIGYQLWCFIYSLIMRGYNLQESELIHSSWCNLHLSMGYCLVNHHRMPWILDPIFWTSSFLYGFWMVFVCVGPIILYQDVGISTRWCIFADPMTKSLPSGWI